MFERTFHCHGKDKTDTIVEGFIGKSASMEIVHSTYKTQLKEGFLFLR